MEGDKVETNSYGGLDLKITDWMWEHTFRSGDEQKKAEAILQTLDGMSVASAKELLVKCARCLDALVIRSCGSR